MQWRDEDAFERHIQSPLMREFDDCVAREVLQQPYTLRRWNRVGEPS